jgi:hypothetical protein
VTALTDALDNADREIDRAEAALAEAKRLMIVLERAPKASRSKARRNVLAELDAAVKSAAAAREHVERATDGRRDT